mgnify:CR=1 FL=1
MKAWIIRWTWSGDHAAVESPLINILSARTGSEEVRKYVERYYASAEYSVADQMDAAKYNKPSEPLYPAQYITIDGIPYTAHITCGHNPFIEAFLAPGVELADSGQDVVWDEHALSKKRKQLRDKIAKLRG